MTEKLYEEAVRTAFTDKPLRTVLLIDDQFPTLADLADGQTEATERRFRQKDNAVELYKAFRKAEMSCDIVNLADEVEPELLYKCDLIVLDYHLGEDDTDPSRSINILRRLAQSKHFNNVVVYTAEPNQDAVWLKIIASLGGGWTVLPASLEAVAAEHWDRLNDNLLMPEITMAAVMQVARSGEISGLENEQREFHRQELLALNVPPGACMEIINALIHQNLTKVAAEHASQPRRRAVGGYADNNRWVQCGNTFITVVQKKAELADDVTDPADILKSLNSAVLAWRPNIIQIIVSEIQNILELDALLGDNDILNEPETQAALIYYLLDILGPINPDNPPDIKSNLTALIDRIVEAVRRRVSTNTSLLDTARNAIVGEVAGRGWDMATWPEAGARVKAAVDLARAGKIAPPDLFFRLNSFLGAEPFSRAHVTTGTIIKHLDSNECFAVASPACDLVPRLPGPNQKWLAAIHDLKAVVCVRLHPRPNHDGALKKASAGEHIFLEERGVKSVYALYDGELPSYEIILVENAGIVSHQADGAMTLSGRRIRKSGAVEPGADKFAWSGETFEVIGQVRSPNANRIMQLATQHLSRIGLDCVKMP